MNYIPVTTEDRDLFGIYRYAREVEIDVDRIKSAKRLSSGHWFVELHCPKQPKDPREVHPPVWIVYKGAGLEKIARASADFVCRRGLRNKVTFYNKNYYPEVPHNMRTHLRAVRLVGSSLIRKLIPQKKPQI